MPQVRVMNGNNSQLWQSTRHTQTHTILNKIIKYWPLWLFAIAILHPTSNSYDPISREFNFTFCYLLPRCRECINAIDDEMAMMQSSVCGDFDWRNWNESAPWDGQFVDWKWFTWSQSVSNAICQSNRFTLFGNCVPIRCSSDREIKWFMTFIHFTIRQCPNSKWNARPSTVYVCCEQNVKCNDRNDKTKKKSFDRFFFRFRLL